MSEEKRDDPLPSDFRVVVYERGGRRKPVGYSRAFWSLRPGSILPYVRFNLTLADKGYVLALIPNRSDSYPAPKIINRELLRQSALRAQEEGFIEFGPESEKDDKEGT